MGENKSCARHEFRDDKMDVHKYDDENLKVKSKDEFETKVYYEDENLKITDYLIVFENKVMPTFALSFFSVHALKVKWWIPIVLVLGGVYGLIELPDLKTLFTILLVVGILLIIVNIIDSRKRVLEIVSHSGNSMSIEVETEKSADKIITALQSVIMTKEEGK